MTDFFVQVVRIDNITKHENADNLSIVNVFGGYPVIIKTGDFKVGDLGIFLSVDAIVPRTQPRFAFLKSDRIKASRLRGVFSMGLLLPLDGVTDVDGEGRVVAGYINVEGGHWLVQEGHDVQELLGVTKHDPSAQREKVKGPTNGPVEMEPMDPRVPLYIDLDNIRKYPKTFKEGDEVVISEKLHGSCSTFAYIDGEFKVGSRNRMRRRPRGEPTHADWWHYYAQLAWWYVLSVLAQAAYFGSLKQYKGQLFRMKRPQHPHKIEACMWWKTAEKYNLEEKLGDAYLVRQAFDSTLAGFIVYGEVYGAGVQDLTYDAPDSVRFAAFDVKRVDKDGTSSWLNATHFDAFCDLYLIPKVPDLHRGPWKEELRALADGPTTLFVPETKPHIREGIVIKSATEMGPNRRILKLVSQAYLLRKDA